MVQWSQKAWVLILLLLPGFAITTHAEDWPMWRGPRGNGVSHESHAPLTWSKAQNIAWKTAIPGRGLSSPIVFQNSVYLTTFLESDQSRRLLRVDGESGEILWNTSIHEGPIEKQHRFNSSASSTPAADSSAVYCTVVDHETLWAVALDHQGQQLWKTSPGSFGSQHGFAASPVLYDGSVIINGHQDGDAFIVALECTSGTTRWRYQPHTNLRSFSTPVLTVHKGKPQLLITGANQTIALDATNGECLWFAEGPNQKAVSSPSVADDIVFSFAGSPAEKAMAIKLGGQGDVSQSHVIWRTEKAMPYVPSPVFAGGFLHVINDAGIYSCLDPQTGNVLKTVRRGGNTYSSPVAAAGRVYMFEDTGRCTVIADDCSYQVLAVNELEEVIQTTPAIANGAIFVRSANHLWCIK